MNTLLKIAYKLRFLLSLFIAFFFGFFFVKMTCHAQYAPSLNNNVFTVFTNTTTEMLDLGFVPQELSPYTPVSTSFWNPWDVGYVALTNFDENDVVISALDDTQKSELLSQFSIVNAENLSLSVSSDIYCVKMDNGYFTGYCYVDENGEILYYTNDLGGQLMQVKYGGSVKDSTAWQEYFADLSQDIKDDNYNLFTEGSPTNLTDLSYYIMWGVTGSGRPADAYSIFIPNQYQKGVIVPTNTNNGTVIASWYCNGTPYVIQHVYGTSTSQRITITSGTYTKDGASYTKRITFTTNNLTIGVNTVPNNNYADWVQGINASNRLLALSGHVYNSSFDNENESVAFKPLQMPEGSNIINYNYYYDPTAISRLESELNNLTQLVNSNFNNQSSISENNFPYYYPATSVEADPSEIPFPNVINYPNFNPLPEAVTDPALNYDVVTQPENATVLESFSNLQIPFLQNIRYRFPFCIPWDIRDALSLLQFSPTAPAWDFNWDIQVGTRVYRYHFAGDLSDFDSLALIFRRLTLCAVIIALAFWSYRIFF